MKPLLLISFSILVIHLSAQNNFKGGYIVLNNLDSVGGEVNYRNWNINPETIEFKTSTAIKTYAIKDLNFFVVYGEEKYKRANITYQLNPASVNNAKDYYSNETNTKRVWLKVLYTAKYSLYELTTNERKYFFIKQPGIEEITEIVYKVRLVNAQLEKDEQYKNQLIAIAKKEGNERIVPIVAAINYNEDDLLKIFIALNNNNGEPGSTKKSGWKIDIAASAALNSFSVKGEPTPYGYVGSLGINNADYASTIGIKAEIGFSFLSGKNFNRFQPRMAMALHMLPIDAQNNKGSYTYAKETYKGTELLLQPNLSFNFLLNPRSKTAFFIAPIVAYNIPLNKNAITATLENPSNSATLKGVPSLSDFLSYGINFNVQSNFGKLFVQYESFGSILDDGIYPTLSVSNLSFGYAFLIKNRK